MAIDIIHIIKLRTGIDDEAAGIYKELAEETIRTYLNYNSDESISRFTLTIISIACSMVERDVKLEESESGLKGESFSEGGVSVSKTYQTQQDYKGYYDSVIESDLLSIRRYRHPNIVTWGDNRDGTN